MVELQKPIIASTLLKLEKQLRCPLCTEVFSDPRVLSCFHVFCEKCLVPLVLQDQQGQLSVRCPTCRQSTLLPAASVSGLQSAFYMKHLVEIQQILEQLNISNTAMCGKCKQQDDTSHFCLRCRQLICSACLCVHERWEELRDHQVVSLDDIQEDYCCLIPHQQTALSAHCLHHPSMTLTLYCETCKELVCNSCVMLEHKQHDNKKIGDAINECKRTVSTAQISLGKKLESISNVLKQLASQRLTISNQQATIEEDVLEQFSKLYKALNEKQEEILHQLNKVTQEKLEALLLEEKETTVFRNHVECCLDFIKHNLKLAPGIELMSTKEHVAQETRKIMNHKIAGSEDEEVHIQFNMVGVDHLISQIGALNATIESPDQTLSPVDSEDDEEHSSDYETTSSQLQHDGDASTEEDDQYELEGTSPESESGEPDLSAVRTMEKICFRVKEPRGITLSSEGQLIVTSESENCVQVFSSNGNTLRTFEGIEPQTFNIPNGVTTDEDDYILIVDTCNHRLHRYTSEWKLSGMVGEAGTDPLQFSNPYGVGYNPINGKIYVCDNCNHRIQILHCKLSLYHTFGARGDEAGQFNHPWGVAFDSTGNVYITDSNNHRIQVFTQDGDFMREFGSEGKERGRLKLPCGIAIDCEGLVYVSEVGNHRISVFTSEGVFQRVIGYKGSGPNQLRQPHELVVDDENGLLYVCDYGNNRIQTFDTV